MGGVSVCRLRSVHTRRRAVRHAPRLGARHSLLRRHPRSRSRRGLAALEYGDRAALTVVLADARPRDGLTLWHLLTRVAPGDRGAVFDRFSQLVALPPEVTREAAVRGDPQTIDLCWNALSLEDTGWWRGWERAWK